MSHLTKERLDCRIAGASAPERGRVITVGAWRMETYKGLWRPQAWGRPLPWKLKVTGGSGQKKRRRDTKPRAKRSHKKSELTNNLSTGEAPGSGSARGVDQDGSELCACSCPGCCWPWGHAQRRRRTSCTREFPSHQLPAVEVAVTEIEAFFPLCLRR